MTYHPVVEKIKNLLIRNNLWFETFEHEPVITSEEAAKVRTGYSLSQGAKAMIVRIKKSETDKKFVMNAGDRRFSIAMKSDDYKKLVSPVIWEIV